VGKTHTAGGARGIKRRLYANCYIWSKRNDPVHNPCVSIWRHCDWVVARKKGKIIVLVNQNVPVRVPELLRNMQYLTYPYRLRVFWINLNANRS
jgi:hypothetical protein